MDNAIKRFWEKVAVAGPDECWEWTANKNPKGYGRFEIRGRKYQVHRISWQLTYGPIPKGLFVCHHCDNRGCVNPAHLFLGTNTDNMQDSARKGRQAQKLTGGEVLKIRELLANGEQSQRSIAKDFGVTESAVSHIKYGERWGWLS